MSGRSKVVFPIQNDKRNLHLESHLYSVVSKILYAIFDCSCLFVHHDLLLPDKLNEVKVLWTEWLYYIFNYKDSMGMFECIRKIGKNILGCLIFMFFCVYSICVPRRIYSVLSLVKIIVESFVCLNQFWRHGSLKNGNPLQYSCLENPMDGGADGPQSMESQRVGQDWATSLHFICVPKRIYSVFPLVKIIVENFVCLNQFWRHDSLKNLEAILSLALILVFYFGQVI